MLFFEPEARSGNSFDVMIFFEMSEGYSLSLVDLALESIDYLHAIHDF